MPFSPMMLPEPGGASQPPWIPPTGVGNQPGLSILRGVWIRGLSDVPIYGLIVSVIQVARSSVAIRERDEQHARLQAAFVQTRLHALQRQLQPHFLFNTLNSISALIHIQPTMADQMLGDLSELLRSALEQEQQPETPLSQEIELLDHYLGIQSVRFGGQLRTVRNFAPETLELLVPTFIFQPLVENAIIHGIGVRTEGGTIWVESQLVGERLLLRVIDDGKGAPSHHKSGIIEGIGLQNTRSRMETLYGSTASLRVGNRQSGGFLVELELPARKSGTPANSTRNLTKDSSTHESATR
jgi:two-component system LytT family sensor kinase